MKEQTIESDSWGAQISEYLAQERTVANSADENRIHIKNLIEIQETVVESKLYNIY